jgi:hypothetical protein
MQETPTPAPKPVFFPGQRRVAMRGKPPMPQAMDPAQVTLDRVLKDGVSDDLMHYKVTLAAEMPVALLRDFVRANQAGGVSDCELMRRALRKGMVSMECVPRTPKAPEPETHPTHFRHGRK